MTIDFVMKVITSNVPASGTPIVVEIGAGYVMISECDAMAAIRIIQQLGFGADKAGIRNGGLCINIDS